MSADRCPPAPFAADAAMWEAAQRVAAAAPEIPPDDEVAIRVQHLTSDFPAFLRERYAGREAGKPAA